MKMNMGSDDKIPIIVEEMETSSDVKASIAEYIETMKKIIDLKGPDESLEYPLMTSGIGPWPRVGEIKEVKFGEVKLKEIGDILILLGGLFTKSEYVSEIEANFSVKETKKGEFSLGITLGGQKERNTGLTVTLKRPTQNEEEK
jgi:hypothetical protein